RRARARPRHDRHAHHGGDGRGGDAGHRRRRGGGRRAGAPAVSAGAHARDARHTDRKARVTPTLSCLCVRPDATVLEAMHAINAGGPAVGFVCGARGKVHGLLTDGDLRRALLAGATLESRTLMTAMRRDFASVPPEATRAEALDLMRARHIEHLPVLDAA